VGCGSACGATQSPIEPSTCTPPGLEGAHALADVPPGCTLSPLGSLDAPAVIDSEAELSQALTCPAGVSPIDLGRESLLVVSLELSPAQAGLGAVDDGTTITFVSRDAPPCPDAFPPRPVRMSFGFRVPRGSERSYRRASCTLPARCE